ncbi:MAG: alpha/beta fold hydrolase [Pseudooceanicola sp.]|nr:alpha/beta fold hydrolase [Pseudooceanicola sp.]
MVALNYTSKGDGKPVVLLHPVGLDRTCWSAVAPLLADRRVIAADLRAHGLSPRDPRSVDVFDYAADVAELIERIGPCPVVGVSFGGMVTTALAISRPDLVTAALISACPSTIPEAGRPVLRARGERPMAEGMESVLAETMDRWFSPGFDAAHYRQHLLGLDPADWNTGWQTIANLDLTARLVDITCPVQLIHAEHDKGTSLEAMQATASGLRDVRLDVIAGAPHMVHIEQPDAFAALVNAHIDRAGA